jgi:IS30 family transposase
LRAVVEAKLALRWSPQQIAAWLTRMYSDDPTTRVLHGRTIYLSYLSLFVQPRGALRRELTRFLRTGRAMRFPRGARTGGGRG